MCAPATLALIQIAVGVAAAAAQAQAQNEQAKASAIHAKEQAKQATASLQRKVAVEQYELRGMQDEAAQEKMTNMLATEERVATAVVSAGEAGVTGLSVDALLADYERQEAVLSGRLDHAAESARFRVGRHSGDLGLQTTGRISDISAGQDEGANYLATGIQIAGTVVDAYGNYARSQPSTSTKKKKKT